MQAEFPIELIDHIHHW